MITILNGYAATLINTYTYAPALQIQIITPYKNRSKNLTLNNTDATHEIA